MDNQNYTGSDIFKKCEILCVASMVFYTYRYNPCNKFVGVRCKLLGKDGPKNPRTLNLA